MLGDLLEACGKSLGVLRSHRREGLQHDEVESSLEKLNTILPCSHVRLPAPLRVVLVHLAIKW